MAKQLIPSKHQRAVLDFVEKNTGNFFIDAVAGSGKSTTLEMVAEVLDVLVRSGTSLNILFVAFNRSIAKSLKARLEKRGIMSVECSTIHSFCLKALNGAYREYNRSKGKFVTGLKNVEADKYYPLCEAALESERPFLDDFRGTVQGLKKLVRFLRLTMTSPKDEEEVRELVYHFDIEGIDPNDRHEWDAVYTALQMVLEKGKRQFLDEGVIDFDDMIAFTALLKEVKVQGYDYILVDEAQDLNKAQLAVITKALKPTGRSGAVGDPFQAIYGFCGADTKSVETIIAKTQAMVLPLSVCYRCPKKVIALIKHIRPGITAAENAPDGTVKLIWHDQFLAMAPEGETIVLCRTTAPLVAECLSFLRNGIKATVRGRDIGKNLTTMLKKINKAFAGELSSVNFYELVMKWQTNQNAIFQNHKNADEKIAQLQDKIDTILAFFDGYQTDRAGQAFTFENFEQYVNSKFSDKEEGVVFSTIHKAKGLEYDSVYILRGDKLPHPMAKSAWEREQEDHLIYVACTRAKQHLYFVDYEVKSLTLPEEIPAAVAA